MGSPVHVTGSLEFCVTFLQLQQEPHRSPRAQIESDSYGMGRGVQGLWGLALRTMASLEP